MNIKQLLVSLFLVITLLTSPFLLGTNSVFKVGTTKSSPLNTGNIFIGGNEDADGDEGTDSKAVKDLESKIEEYEKKLAKLKTQSSSLANEIEQANSQIYLTELRIQSALAEIARKESQVQRLGADIENLEDRIDKLTDSIGFQNDVLGERIRARYKTHESSPVLMLFGSDTLKELVQRTKYLKVMEIQDKKLLDDMTSTKEAFTFQKDIFEEKKVQAEQLKAQVEEQKVSIEAYQSTLEEQKKAKEYLLSTTQNDEAKYQKLLADAQKELNQITGAASVLKNTAPRDVKKGDLIGIQGNTGYSFGDHLHFGVYRYGDFDAITGWNWYYSNTVDPAKKLKSKDVYWNDGCSSAGTKSTGKGDWGWPMNNPTVSQGYGTTCYSNSYYGGKIHPAFDMYGPIGSPIYAAEKGKAYFCRNCLGDGANGVFIFHPDDYMTVHWHLQ